MSQTDPGEMEDGDRVTVVGLDRPPASLPRRIVRWIGGLFLWLLVLAPGLLIIRYGLGAVLNERIVGRRGFRTTSYGDDAVGFGWIFIGVGFWALGEMSHLKTGRRILRLIGWILAGGAHVIGCWFLVRRFVQS